MSGVTVIDICRELGVEITPELKWSVGAEVRARYEARFGRLSDKELRTKTSGTGSHCFAVYPGIMVPDIREVIRAHRAEAQRQGSLF
jgi:hypothetical protein